MFASSLSSNTQFSSIVKHVETHLNQHNYDSAAILADKLLTMAKNTQKSKNEIFDYVFLLAKCYWCKGEKRRACRLIRMQGNSNGVRERFLAAKCMEEVCDWNECLNILGIEEEVFTEFISVHNDDEYVASLCFMRAKCLEIFEKREQAAYWYKTTLMKDPSFIQAYDKLVDGFMTTEKEEEDLLKSIQFPECDQWLKSFYEVKLQKFEQKSQKQKEERINVLVTQYHLQDNADIMTQIATLHFNNREYEKVYQITKFVMEQDPYHLPLIPIHILTLLFLKKKTDLFYHAHKLAEDGSFGTRTAVLANFASACYYYACGRWDMARKYFAKSSSIDCKFLPALLGIGHSLSQANDPDLALASYRSTSRQFPNSPFPLLYMAMEHIKSNELHFAEPLIMSALEKRNCVEAWNEWGVILLKKGETEKSIGVLAQAISMCPTGEYENEIDPSFEYILYNLATAYRKARKFKIAYELYLRCMRLNGEETSIYTALGLTCHLTGELHEAIEWYHKGMARSKDGTGDNFVATMLAKCLNQISEQSFEYMFSQ